MAREAGASKVYFASCSPAIRYPNVYGIDMPSFTELVAHGRTEEEVSDLLGADAVVYLDLPSLVESCKLAAPSHVQNFECSVFDGVYVTGDVSKEYFERTEAMRTIKQNGSDVELVGLFNHFVNSH